MIEWGIPLTTLALVPKCPMCVAAYVLLFTGVGMSASTARMTRWTVIALSAAAIAWLVVRVLRRKIRADACPPNT